MFMRCLATVFVLAEPNKWLNKQTIISRPLLLLSRRLLNFGIKAISHDGECCWNECQHRCDHLGPRAYHPVTAVLTFSAAALPLVWYGLIIMTKTNCNHVAELWQTKTALETFDK